MRTIRVLAALCLFAGFAFGQAETHGVRNLGILGLPSGSSLPATCGVNELFFKTGVTAGLNLYGCTSTNTWTLLGGGNVFNTTIPDLGGGTRGVDTSQIPLGTDLQQGKWTGALCTGSGTYTCSPTQSFVGAPKDGTSLAAIIPTTNSGAATITVNAFGPYKVYKNNESAQITTASELTATSHTFVFRESLDAGNGGFVLQDGGGGSSGQSLTASGTYFMPFGGPMAPGQSSPVMALAAPYYFHFNNPYDGGLKVTKVVIPIYTNEASKDVAIGIYNSACTLVAQSTTLTNAWPGSFAPVEFTFSSPPTLTNAAGDPGWFLGIASNCTSCTLMVQASGNANEWGQLLRSQGTKHVFSGSTAATQAGGAGTAITMPSSCGTKTDPGSNAAAQPVFAVFFN